MACAFSFALKGERFLIKYNTMEIVMYPDGKLIGQIILMA